MFESMLSIFFLIGTCDLSENKRVFESHEILHLAGRFLFIIGSIQTFLGFSNRWQNWHIQSHIKSIINIRESKQTTKRAFLCPEIFEEKNLMASKPHFLAKVVTFFGILPLVPFSVLSKVGLRQSLYNIGSIKWVDDRTKQFSAQTFV